MSKSNILPFNYNGVQLVVQQDENGDPLFEVNSLCELLQYSNSRDALSRHVSTEDVVKRDTLTAGGKQKKNFVKERGMWKLLMKSNAPNAEPVQDWIAGEVLPSIRKTGGYTAPVAKQASELAPLRTQRAISLAIDNGDKIKSRLPLLGDAAMQSIYAGLVNTAAGSAILPLARLEEKHKSATEVGAIFGVNRNTIGRLANQHNLKTAEYGHWELGNAEHNTSQRETFVYNAKAVEKFRSLLSGANDNQKEGVA